MNRRECQTRLSNRDRVALKDELISELVAGCQNEGDLFGPDGVFTRLEGAVMEKLLEAEVTDHLGHDRHERRAVRHRRFARAHLSSSPCMWRPRVLRTDSSRTQSSRGTRHALAKNSAPEASKAVRRVKHTRLTALTLLCLHCRYRTVKARIQRWGNSLALRLPKSVAESMGVGEGSVVALEERDGQLVVSAAHRYRLADLLAEVRPEQVHGEVSTGAPRGKESW